MSEFLIQGNHFTINHVWFETAQNFPFQNSYDILVLHGHPEPLNRLGNHRCTSELQRTCVTDLTKPEEELFSLVSKSIRNHVNRSKRENVQITVYREEADILSVLDDFAEMYRGMFLEKDMPDKTLDIPLLKAYAKQDALIVTTAAIDGQVVKFNAHIHNGTQARGLYGCSQFRTVDKETYNAIGRAGEYLDWMDLLYCKQLGITEYDWGGITSFEEPNGIDKYKMKFGVEFREYYNITCRCSLRSKIVYHIKHLLGKA